VLALAFTGWGEALGLYDRWGWYDTVVHFLVPMLTAPVAYLALARLDVVPDLRDHIVPRREAGIFVVTLALGIAVGAVWEIFEYASDGLLGSELQEGNTDTVRDLGADTIGAAVGAALLVAWSEWGWGSVKRLPGVNTREETSA
jgi:uncharacterized membrane protein YjdF